MSDNCGFVRLDSFFQAPADRLILSSALPGFPSPSPITHTTTTSDANNALGAQLFDNSGLFATSLISSPITYNATNTHSDDNALGLHVSTVTPSPRSSGDKAKPKARSSAHATSANNIKASGKEKKKHAEGYKRKSLSCEHCRQRRKECDGTDFNACTRCTWDGSECTYVLAKGKRGSQKALKKLAAMGRTPSADGIIIGTPSTSSLASSSGMSSMSPITPTTPARSFVELSSCPSPASVSAGHTSGYATPHIFMPFVPPTQTPLPVGANGMMKDHRVVEMQQALFDTHFDSCCSVLAAAPASESAAPYHPPTPRTTPVKPTYVRPVDVSPVQAPHFSLNNTSVLYTLPPVVASQPQIPAVTGQGLSESERLAFDELVMDLDLGDNIFSAPAEDFCSAATVAALPTPDTTPVKPTVEMSAVSDSADPTSFNFSYAGFFAPDNTPRFSAPQTQVGNEAVGGNENVGWGMCGTEEMEMSDAGSWGAIESPFNATPFGDSFTPVADEAADCGMRGLWD
ncbi:hypothetical protein L202_02523 [Cryptococcus amylolentus CBS 6039]|uniref:Zn(2)-C6 fungal-type domain-containing protein n=2 Tax=Cryptococcus amylolentus TaxID=104669 RepID=A0A1E3I156_9TREE|nr:hypothetical protein L202_02523 [Cryptococcus amylolentus CBS 6039]ODN82238.1 hypothetical protein L202_02523 [Cryptococcus amylolentus CBS 6039]ODO09681.1 hypothetical protein I350_01895 [Cryptococcus amylolentus CBS 6273]